MEDTYQKAQTADRAIAELVRIEKLFLDGIEALSATTCDIGTLVVTGKLLSCTCLGRKVVGTSRPVVVGGNISALEYDFITEWRKDDYSVLRLYLQPKGFVTSDPRGEVKLCDFTNTYIKKLLLTAISEALLASPIYAPSEG